jgi:DNA replication licensing factor MCM2
MNIFDAALNTKQGFPVFATVLEANYVLKRADGGAGSAPHLTDEERRAVEALARDPGIVRRIYKSIAPSIYGNEHVKLACALALFGGCEKNVDNKHRIRGDINCLLLGDPGMVKIQLLACNLSLDKLQARPSPRY